MSVLEQAKQIQAQTDARIAKGRVETQELKKLLAETLAGIEGVGRATSPKSDTPHEASSRTFSDWLPFAVVAASASAVGLWAGISLF